MDTIGGASLLIFLVKLALVLVQTNIPVFDLELQYKETAVLENPVNIVEIGSYGSCMIYDLVDQHGESLVIPKEIENAMDCPVVLSLFPDSSEVIYEKDGEILSYAFASPEFTTLAQLDTDIEGVSNIFWSPGGEKLAFITINQEYYPEATKLHVVSLGTSEKTDVASPGTQTFDIKARFSCGSICTTMVNEDIWFEDEQTIKYYTYKIDPYEERTEDLLLILSLR